MINQVLSKKCLRAFVRDFIDFSEDKVLFINMKPGSRYLSTLQDELAEHLHNVRGIDAKTINFNSDMRYIYDEWLAILNYTKLDVVIISNFNCFAKEQDLDGKTKCYEFLNSIKTDFAGNKLILIGADILCDKCLPVLDKLGDVIDYNSAE